jgi:hypothetical protein
LNRASVLRVLGHLEPGKVVLSWLLHADGRPAVVLLLLGCLGWCLDRSMVRLLLLHMVLLRKLRVGVVVFVEGIISGVLALVFVLVLEVFHPIDGLIVSVHCEILWVVVFALISILAVGSFQVTGRR